MGQKRTLPSRVGDGGYHLVDGAVMTSTDVVTSETFNIQNLDNVGLQIEWTGDAVGTIEIKNSVNNATFHSFTFAPALAQPNGTDGGFSISLNQIPFPYVQVVYTNESGDGVLDVWLSAKDLN